MFHIEDYSYKTYAHLIYLAGGYSNALFSAVMQTAGLLCFIVLNIWLLLSIYCMSVLQQRTVNTLAQV